MPEGICKLCKKDSELQLSHFIPKFIGKWLKDTSATGFIRFNQSINKRSQDIAKDYWLCRSCEQLFSAWEREFANRVFYPFMDKEESEARYGSWLSKFCASLTWRTLTYARSLDNTHSPKVSQKYDLAEAALAAYLLGEGRSLGVYEQHLYPIAGIAETNVIGAPPNLNRYLLRTMQMSLPESETSQMIYTKLPGFILIGLTGHKDSNAMRSSRVALAEGRLSLRSHRLPRGFLQYIFDEAQDMTDNYSNMDQSQKDKVSKSILSNPERFKSSKTFEAFKRDLSNFGVKAFSQDNREI
ncbi:hypothetical protein ACQKEN_16905 [Pseudomonas sp. NPDC078416]|uniref:hypothetical protein n=1 Tax=Pseudomonas sp. NPDC078416 TaxID=3390637 RepID=UPI003CFE6132